MADEQLARLLLRFRLAAQEHAAAVESMNEGMANREATIIARLYKGIEAKGEEGTRELLALTWSDDDAVAGMAAVYSLRQYPSQAVAVLRRLAKKEGMLGFRASCAVERWEKGEWEL